MSGAARRFAGRSSERAIARPAQRGGLRADARDDQGGSRPAESAGRHLSAAPSKDIFAAVEFLKEAGPPALRRVVANPRGAAYAEVRFEAMFSRPATAVDGEPRHGA